MNTVFAGCGEELSMKFWMIWLWPCLIHVNCSREVLQTVYSNLSEAEAEGRECAGKDTILRSWDRPDGGQQRPACERGPTACCMRLLELCGSGGFTLMLA